MDNVGTLPDFGNFCMADEGYGSVFDGTCATIYDFYKGVEEMMPKAFAVSAKSNDFDENGDEKTIDYTKMLKILLKALVILVILELNMRVKDYLRKMVL